MAAVATEFIRVEVVYALANEQRLISLNIPPGATAMEAVKAARLEDYFPSFVLKPELLGLWGIAFGTKGLPPSDKYLVKDGDRIECYRPLTCDPMEVRRRRAAKAALKRV